MTTEQYFYFEWLIIEKQMTPEIYSSLSKAEIFSLIDEYGKFKKQLNKFK